MIRRIMGLGVCMFAATLLPVGGCSKGDNGNGGNGGGNGGVYKTPKEAFNAVKTGFKNGDWEVALGAMTNETQRQMAGDLAVAGVMMNQFAKLGKADKKTAKIGEVLSKHGLAEEKIDLKQLGPDRKKLSADLAKKVKNKPAFVGDMMNAMGQKTAPDIDEIANTKLKDVKIDGNKATGTIVTMKNGQEGTEQIQFVNENGSWRVDLMSMKKSPAGPGPGN